jgi:hypothetical protein
MLKLLIVLVSLVLVGCDIDRWEIDSAEHFCVGKGGIHHMHIDAWESVVVCINSSSTHISHPIPEDQL